ncbi:response regulator transcription factor [Pontibacter sp. MBLB2868]|uniref:response regulator transcription factor n=1 Tax=Pontibacter sp. MBLB2868 TaxID=3451555 RepID=UPI003F750AB2
MSTESTIRLIITDDHRIIREGLMSLLEHYPEIKVVGEASNGQELLDLLATTPAHVVLMDINMPVMDGFEATKQVKTKFPETKVIALSMLANIPYVQKILTCGASGYLLKTTDREELRAAIKLVAADTNYISGDLSISMLGKAMNQEVPAVTTAADKAGLSKREIEVLSLIAEGFTNAEIADKLFTSKRTIETHRQHILEKTNAKNTANLIKFAIENKILKIGKED